MSSIAASVSACDEVRTKALQFIDRRYELIHQIRREPVKSIGLAFSAGLVVGLMAALAIPTCHRAGAEAAGLK